MEQGQQQQESERRPPHNAEAERAAIGIALVDPSSMASLSKLSGSDFFLPCNRTAWETIALLHDRGDKVDVITVGEAIRAEGLWETFELGWMTWAMKVASEVPSVALAPRYAQIVRENAIRRDLISFGAEISCRAYASDDVEDLLASGRNQLSEIEVDAAGDKESERLGDAMSLAVANIVDRCDSTKKPKLIKTGIWDFDHKTGGLAEEEVVIVAARPGMGKTSYVNGVALYASDNGVPVGLFSVEMSKQREIERFISMETGIPASFLRAGRTNEGEPLGVETHKRIIGAAERFTKNLLWINDTATSLGAIIGEARRWYAKEVTGKGYPIGLIIVDYLQLVEIESRGRFDSREQQVARMSRAFKKLAKALHCAIIIVAQLNRDVEKRGGDPRLSDLRECLSGETRVQDAATGKTKTIRELVGETNFQVFGLGKGLKLERATAARFWSTGRRITFTVRTASGRSIRATATHPFLAADGWKPLGALALGERVAVPRMIPEPEQISNGYTLDELRLLGFLISDGHYGKHRSVGYVKGDKVLVNEVRRVALERFGIVAKDHPCEGTAEQIELTVPQGGPGCNPLIEWLKLIGVHGQLGPQKRIPEDVFCCDNAHLSVLLGALWSGDGCVMKRKGGGWSLKFSSTSMGLLGDLQHLLGRLGIISCRTRPGRNTKSTIDIAEVFVSDSDAIRTFAGQVKLYGVKQEKLERASLWAQQARQRENAHIDRLPLHVTEKVKAEARRQSFSWSDLGYRCQGKEMSRVMLGKVARRLGSAQLLNLAESDLLWDQIQSIEPHGEEEVFDARVPTTANFVANGFVVHNSGAVEQDADLILFVIRDVDKEDPDNENGDCPARIIAGKNRTGPIGQYKAAWKAQTMRFISRDTEGRAPRETTSTPHFQSDRD